VTGVDRRNLLRGFYGWTGDVQITGRALTPRQFLST